MKKFISLFSFVFLFYSCEKKTTNVTQTENDFEARLIALVVKDLNTSIKWYKEKLGFETETEAKKFPDYNLKIALLKLGNFHLELIENGTSVEQKDLPLKAGSSINGFLKFGLMADNIDAIYTHLKTFDDVDFITQVGDLPPSDLDIKWPKKFLLIRDPDGNMIQFFSHAVENNNNGLKPWLIGITVKDIEKTKNWYVKNLDFKFHTTVGEKGNLRSIIERNNFIIELFEPANVTLYDDMEDKKEYQGIRKFAFGSVSFEKDFQYLKRNDNKFIFEPRKTEDINWANQSMIIKDIEGNWIQIYDSNKF